MDTISFGPFFDRRTDFSYLIVSHKSVGLTNFVFFGFDIPNRTATIFNGGNTHINATILDSIA
ncbi:hypothetical protein CPB86DRAFT_790023 [Serendipita vermifera]|nr:hypothetical protein CPB86DRAFT_790023 [Serendipita vermifera]